MFPIPWNKAYRKKDGSLTIIDDMFVDVSELEEEIDALDGKIDDVGDSITPVSQTGTKATTAITAGTQFYLNGTLVKAKTNIASGDTFTSGTNYDVADDITTQIGNLSATLDDNYVLVSRETITLAIANGSNTVDTLMTQGLTGSLGLQSITPSSRGATHMKLVSLSIPYAEGATSTVTGLMVFPELGLLTSFENTSSIICSRIGVGADTLTNYGAVISTSANRFGSITFPSPGTYLDYLSKKPANGAEMKAVIEFYKKL